MESRQGEHREVVLRDKAAELSRKRENEVKAYGALNTRRNKRKSERLYQASKESFDKLTKAYINKTIEVQFDQEDESLIELFNQSNQMWLLVSRSLINKNPKIYNTAVKRERYLNSFSSFVKSLNDKLENTKNGDK